MTECLFLGEQHVQMLRPPQSHLILCMTIPSTLWFPLSKSSSSRIPEVPRPNRTTSLLVGPIRCPTEEPHPEEDDEWLPEDDVQLAEPVEFKRRTGRPPKVSRKTNTFQHLNFLNFKLNKISLNLSYTVYGLNTVATRVLPRPVKA